MNICRSGKRSGALLLSSIVLLAMLLPAMLLCGCGTKGFGKDADGKIKVVATIYPVYDFVRRIGGDQVAVTMMVPAGTEPHTWEPSSKDMLKLEEADLFVYSGAGMETWAEDLLKGIQNKDLKVLEASEGIKLLEIADEDHDDHDHGRFDPHVWLSPRNAEVMLQNIAEILIKIDPDHESVYKENLNTAKKACEELDGAYSSALKDHEGEYIVVAHEAYGYLCQQYGLVQIGIEGVSADSEPDAARMREIIDMVEEYDIRCVFFEELVSPKVAQAIAEETGCNTASICPLDGLTQEDIDSGRDYFSVMKDNLEAICSSFSA